MARWLKLLLSAITMAVTALAAPQDSTAVKEVAPAEAEGAWAPPALLQQLAAHQGAPHLLLAAEEGDADEVARSMPTDVSLTLLPCAAPALLGAVEAVLLKQTLHTVMLLCPLQVLVDVLRQIYNKSLENRRVQWLQVTGGSGKGGNRSTIEAAVWPLLREGTQLVLVGPEESSYFIERATVVTDNSIRFVKVSQWRPTTPPSPLALFPALHRVYRDFEGRQLTVMGNDGGIFVTQPEDDQGNYPATQGIDFEIVKILASKLNFTFRFERPADGKWGGVTDDGPITGMIGAVARHEAHMATDGITITASRETVVDFTFPYAYESSIIISKAPGLKSAAFSILRPYSMEVWIILICCVLAIGPVTWAIDRAGQRTERSQAVPPRPSGPVTRASSVSLRRVPDYSFNMLRTLLLQGNKLTPSSLALSLLFAAWYFFGLVIAMAYSGSLTAVFAAPSYETPINTLQDVVTRARANPNLDVFLTKDTSVDHLFERATSGTFKQLGDILDPDRPASAYMERYDKIKRGLGVTFSSPLYFYLNTIPHGYANFYVGTEMFYFQSYGFALPNGSPYKSNIEDITERLVNAGLMNQIIRRELQKKFSVRVVEEVAKGGTWRQRIATKAITLQTLQGAFMVLVLGYLVGVLALLGEAAAASISGQRADKSMPGVMG